MSQVNSGIGTKACTYDFTKDGALGDGIYSFSGISIKPGEAIADIRVVKGANNLTSGSEVVNFFLGWGPNPSPGFAFQPFFQDTIANINTYLFYLHQSSILNVKWQDGISPRIPATVNGSSNLWFTSDHPLTGGSVNFIITYLYTKF